MLDMATNFVQDKEELLLSKRSSESPVEKSIEAPFSFEYIENQLRRKHFGILSTISANNRPHSVGVVYSVSPFLGEDNNKNHPPFCLYLITRPVLKKARNIRNNPNVSFVVPFPHYMFRMLPPACIQFQGKAEFLPINDPMATKAFQGSIVLRRSMEHSLRLGESTFIRIVPDSKIFTFGINANIWQHLMQSKNKTLGNHYVVVPQSRRIHG
jgi:pyridoxamine 5'-phosphate oxidase-like protein